MHDPLQLRPSRLAAHALVAGWRRGPKAPQIVNPIPFCMWQLIPTSSRTALLSSSLTSKMLSISESLRAQDDRRVDLFWRRMPTIFAPVITALIASLIPPLWTVLLLTTVLLISPFSNNPPQVYDRSRYALLWRRIPIVLVPLCWNSAMLPMMLPGCWVIVAAISITAGLIWLHFKDLND